MAKANSGKSDYFWLGLRTYGPVFFKSLSAFLLTGFFSPDLVGTFSLFWMLAVWLAGTADAGVKVKALGKSDFNATHLKQWQPLLLTSSLLSAVSIGACGFGLAFVLQNDSGYLVTIAGMLYALLYGLSASFFALRQRNGSFKELARIELFCVMIAAVISWAIALWGNPFFSIGFLYAGPPFFSCVWMLIIERKAAFSISSEGKSLRYDWKTVIAELLDVFIRKADSFAIGFFSGTAVLGLYNRAFSVVHYPDQVISGILNPSRLALLQQGKTETRTLFYAIASGFFLMLAAGWPVVLFSEQWIPAVWSEEWLGVSAFFPPLFAGGLALWVTRSCDAILVFRESFTLRFMVRIAGSTGPVFLSIALIFFEPTVSIWLLTAVYILQAVFSVWMTFRGWSGLVFLLAPAFLIVSNLFFNGFPENHLLMFFSVSGPAFLMSWYYWAKSRNS